MSAATSPGTGPAYGLRRVCAAWGLARSSFYAMTSGQNAERPPANEARDLGPGAAGGHRGRPGDIALGGRGLPQGLGSASGLSRHPGYPQAVLRLMRENNLLSPHRCRRRGGNPHDGEIITHVPRQRLWDKLR